MYHTRILLLVLIGVLAPSLAVGQDFLFGNGFENPGLTGRILDANAFVADGSEVGVAGAAVRLLGSAETAFTRADGRFSLAAVPTGAQVLDIDVSGAQQAPNGDSYAGFREKIDLVIGQNVITRPLYLPRIDASTLTTVDPGATTTVRSTRLGITLTVEAGSAFDQDGNLFDGQLSISEVPDQLAPAALPEDMGPGMLFTIQPVGVTFEPPAPLRVANTIDNLPAGKRVDFWSLDPNRGVFTVVGVGEVSQDGSTIETIAGGVRAADWHAPIPPPPFNATPPNDELPTCNQCCIPGQVSRTNYGAGDTQPRTCPLRTAANVPQPIGDGNVSVGSVASLNDGQLMEYVALPPYVSLNKSRSLEFIYSSLRANPVHVMTANSAIPADAPLPNSISYQGFVDGVDQGYEIFVDPSGLDPDIEEPFRVSMPLDGTSLTTGIYPAAARIRNHYAGSTPSTRINRNVGIINDRESPYGAGWRLQGLDRLYINDSGGVLLVDGAGSGRQFFGGSGGGSEVLLITEQPRNSLPDTAAALLEEMEVPFRYFNGTFDQPEFPRVDMTDLDSALVVIWAATAPTCQFINTTREACTALINLFVEARSRGIPILFIGDKLNPWDLPFGASQRVALAEPELSTYEDLTRLLRESLRTGQNCGFGCFPWALNQPGHPVFVGPYGDSSGLDHSPLINDNPVRVGRDETVLAQFSRNGELRPYHPIMTYRDPESGANIVTVSNRIGTVPATGFAIPAQIVFKNTVDWLIQTSSQGQPGQLRSPNSDSSELTENPDGTYTRRLKNGYAYQFNSEGLLTSASDRNGNTMTYEYNEDRLIRITDPVGRQTTLTYTNNKLASVTDPAGRQTLFSIDDAGDLRTVTFPDGSTRRFEYDSKHLLTTQTDQRNFSTTYQYNSAGQFNQSTQADGSIRSLVPSQQVGYVDPSGKAGTRQSPVKVSRPIW